MTSPLAQPPGPDSNGCSLCAGDGGSVLWRDARLRIVAVADADYPAFLRVIWNAHVREMSDLSPDDRQYLLRAMLLAEDALRHEVAPEKINLASLGNVTPHLHWHVIARHAQDPHFPNPVWGARLREAPAGLLVRQRTALAAVERRIGAAMPSATSGW